MKTDTTVTQLLIIEDEVQIRENLAELLTLNGYQVETASDGREGVLRAMLFQPDLIICDVMMPRMDGYQVLDMTRSNRTLANVPFIFLTARTDPGDRRQGMALGADDYLTKPFTSRDLLTAISSRLEREKNRQAAIQAQITQYRNELNRVSSHEYNTPLTGIMGFTNLLTDFYDTFSREETLSILGMITTSCLRLKRTLDNVRLTEHLQQTTSYASAGTATHRSPFTNALVRQVEQDLIRRHGKTTPCQIEVEDTCLAMPGDALLKMLDELMDNAFKFSSADSPFSVLGQHQGVDYQVSITNHGPVFSPESVARIGPYTQFDRDVYEQQGLGLGLYIAKQFVEQNGGCLSIEGQPDGQTTVSLRLPVAASHLTKD